MSQIPTEYHNNLDSRVSSLETSVAQIKDAIGEISKQLTSLNRTNWGTVIAAIALIGTIWAALIHPINADVSRQSDDVKALAVLQSKSAETLAAAVVKQNELVVAIRGEMSEKIAMLAMNLAEQRTRADATAHDLANLNATGSSGTHEHLSILDLRVERLEKAGGK